jgi:hypothetical protein
VDAGPGAGATGGAAWLAGTAEAMAGVSGMSAVAGSGSVGYTEYLSPLGWVGIAGGATAA